MFEKWAAKIFDERALERDEASIDLLNPP